MLSIVLALSAAVSWGIADFLGGFNSRRVGVITVLLATQIVGLLVLAPLAMLHGQPQLEPRHVGFAIAGSLAGLVGIGSLYRGMAVGSVSIVAPISATGAGLPVVLAILRGEHASALQITGIVLALIGIVLASMVAERDNARRRLVGPGVGLAILAALGFGFFFVWLHEASLRDVLWAGVIQRSTGVLTMLVITLFVRPSVAGARQRGLGLVAAGTLDTAANVLYSAASVTGLVSLAAVLASLYPVATVLLAGAVLRERITRRQTIGIISALVGVACIATP